MLMSLLFADPTTMTTFYVKTRDRHGIEICVNSRFLGNPNAFSLEGLPAALHQHRLETHLELKGAYKSAYDRSEFFQFCLILKKHLPAVTSLEDFRCFPVDSRTAKLVECFPNLVKLRINSSGGTLAFQAIGGLKKLEEIIIAPSYGMNDEVMTPQCCEFLANSLEELLRKVTVDYWYFSEPRECWWPLVCALGGKPNLDVDIHRTGIHYRRVSDQPNYVAVIDDDQWNILQNGLTLEQKLMEVQRRYDLNPPDGRNLKSILEDTNAEVPISRWVETVVSLNARNQVDCVQAMMGKLSAIPEERVDDWALAMIEFHQQGQFACFHMIFDSIKPRWISNRTYWES